MDGTLTLAAHDFDAFKKEQGMDEARPYWNSWRRCPPKRHRCWVRGCGIRSRYCRSRETGPRCHSIAPRTAFPKHSHGNLDSKLESPGVSYSDGRRTHSLFDERDILGGNAQRPPDPAGLLQILSRWQIPGSEAVTVGDYLFDLTAGRAADMFTIYIDRYDSGLWQDEVDLRLTV